MTIHSPVRVSSISHAVNHVVSQWTACRLPEDAPGRGARTSFVAACALFFALFYPTLPVAAAYFVPEAAPGITTTGDLSFSSGDTVSMEINGTTPGTDHDQFDVTGTVNLDNDSGGGATLSLLFGYAPTIGDSYLIIANDGTDAVSGTFADLPEGGYGRQSGVLFQITYVGGDGNDVIISFVAPLLLINEIDYDQVGTDNAEFVELKNSSGTPLALNLFSLVLIDGTGGGGSIYNTIALTNTTLANDDYYVICGNAGLVDQCDQIVPVASDLIQDGAPDAVALLYNGAVVDAVSYEGDSGAPYVEGSGSGLADTDTDARLGLSRYPDGSDTNQNSVDFSARCITPGATNSTFNASCDQPEIALSGAGTAIVDGALAVTTTNGTDFGRHALGTTVTHTFTISNSGPYSLTLSGSPAIAVTPSSEFSLAVAPATTVASGASTTFALAFSSTVAGIYTATIQIENNDSDEGLYRFVVQGEAQPAKAATNGTTYVALQEAIDAAGSGDIVRLRGATLADHTTVAGLTQLGYITKSLTIEGGCDATFTTCLPGTPTTLDAQGAGRGLVISGTIGVTLTNLIVRGGDASAVAGDGNGGGLLINGSTVLLLDTTITNNSAINGGGLYVGSTVTCGFTCVIANNSATNGGGVFLNSTGITSTFVLAGGQIVTNTATTNGGGVYLDDVATVYTQTAGLIGNNSAVRYGGGLYGNAGTLYLAGGAVNHNRTTNSGPFEGGGGLYLSANMLATVQDVTIAGNRVPNGTGGGLYSRVTDLAVTNTQLVSNTAENDGGGLVQLGGTLFITGSTVMSNTAGSFGGGINASTATIENTDFINNESDNAGGALSVGDGTVTDSRFWNNRSDAGGALFIDGDTSVYDSDFWDNGATDGGALFVENTATIRDSRFTHNSATVSGGAILNQGDVDVARSHFVGNHAALTGAALALYGDGMPGESSYAGDGTVVNNLFRNNSTAANGAVIAINATGEQILFHNTIVSATQSSGAGIAVFGNPDVFVDIVNTIVAGHTIGLAASTGSVGEESNLIDGATTPISGTIVSYGDTLIDVDPLFQDPANDDYSLANLSPARENALDLGVSDDIDATDRPKYPFPDIGSYESAYDVAAVNGARFKTLQAAVNAASGGDLIKVAALTLTDLYTYGNFVQIGYITKALTIEGGYDLDFSVADPETPTVLDADYGGRVLVISGTIPVTLTNLIVTHGDALSVVPFVGTIPPTIEPSAAGLALLSEATPGERRRYGSQPPVSNITAAISEDPFDYSGGGILIHGSEVWLENTVVTENDAGAGGGVAIGSTLYCGASCLIANNYAFSGGGILVSTAITTSTLVLNGGSIISNTAEDSGGGVFVEGPTGYISMTAGTIADNLSFAFGGGLTVDGGTADLLGGTIENNSASGVHPFFGPEGYGGGLYQYESTVLLGGTEIRGNSADFYGGGLYLDNGLTTITNTTISENQVITDFGGGIYVDGGLVTIDNSLVVSNTAGDDGGGLYVEEDFYLLEPLTITNSIFRGNSVLDSGGGIYAGVYSTVTVRSSLVISNSAVDDGGGLRAFGAATLTVIDSIVQDNLAESSGGGIYVSDDATLDLISSQVLSNTAIDDGGGIRLYAYGSGWITDTLVQGNHALDSGGGIYPYDAYVTVIDSTVIDNQADDSGGGVKVYGLDGYAELIDTTIADNRAATVGGGLAAQAEGIALLENVTVSGNDATAGGGLYAFELNTTVVLTNVSVISNTATISGGGVGTADGDLWLNNTLIGNNSAPLGNDCAATVNSDGTNLVEDPTDCTGLTGTDLTNADPVVGPLQDNGGPAGAIGRPTLTHALRAGSPALDAGDDPTCTTIDARHVDRPQSTNCDIGAFEAVPAEMALLGNGIEITAGDTTPTLTDHTDFGTTHVGTAITRTFTISNSGQIDLLLTDPDLVQISSSTPFTLVTTPAATIAPGMTTTFQVRFLPPAEGVFTATIAIDNTDPDESPYDFVVQGTAYADPTVTKTVSADPAAAGEALTYTVVITNSSAVTITNATISDTLPTAATLVAGSVTLAPAQAAATVAVNNADLPTLVSGLTISPTSQVTVTYVVTTAQSFTGTVVNTAHVTATTPLLESRGTVTHTIWRNDLTIGDATLAEGDSGTAIMTFVVSRTHNFNAVLVDYGTADGTAIAASDYSAAGGTLSFTATGPLTQSITIAVNGDLVIEADETFTVTLSNASGALIDDDTATGTILNDDSATVTLTGGDTVLEGDSGTATLVFTTTLDAAVQDGFTLSYSTNDGTATTTDNDYLDNDGTLAFAGTLGETQLITVAVVGDGRIEADETLTVTLGTMGGTAIDSSTITVDSTVATGTILDDDNATVAFVPVTDITSEEDGTYAVTVQLSSTTPITLTAPLAVVLVDPKSGTADADGVDYSFTTPTTVTFPAGSTTAATVTATLAVTNDTLAEGDEALQLQLSSVTDPFGAVAIESSADQLALTIVDNDVAYTLGANQATVIEGDSGSTTIGFTITRTGAITTTGGTVDVNFGGAATSGSDYDNIVPATQQVSFVAQQVTATVTLDVLGDQIDENDEPIDATLSAPTVSTAGGTASVAGGTESTTILDDDSAGIVVTGDSSTPIAEAGATRFFTVTLLTVPTATVTVTIYIDDQLELGAGSGVSTTLTFPAGSGALTPQRFPVVAVDDTVVEAASKSSTLIFGVQSGDPNYDGYPLSELPLTVLDNDSTTIAIADNTVTEGDSGTVTVALTVTLDQAVDLPFTIDYTTADNSATLADNDYSAISGTLTFSGTAGETHVVQVAVQGDQTVEADEDFFVNLSNLTFATPRAVTIADGQATATILNDDRATVSLIGSPTHDEGDSGTTSYIFTATLDSAVVGGFAVDYQSSDGTALPADNDYVAASGTLTFTGSASESHTITLLGNGDTVVELDETLTVALGAVTGPLAAAVDVDPTPATATIRNDDSATLALVGGTLVEGDSGVTSAIFTATLTGAVDSSISITYTTSDGSATVADSDYQAASGTLAFSGSAGETQLVAVNVVGDTVVEADETFVVALGGLNSNGRAVTLDPSTATMTIRNDDQVAVSIDDVALDEGSSGTTAFLFTVLLDSSAAEEIAVTVDTAAGTARAGSDFTAISSQVVTISAGLTGTQIAVAVVGDTVVEADETFSVTLSNPLFGGVTDASRLTVNDSIGLGRIDNDDTAQFEYRGSQLAEGDSGLTTFVYTMTLLQGVEDGFALDYTSYDQTATVLDGDYGAVSGTLYFVGNAGEALTVTVPVYGDTKVEEDEYFVVSPTTIYSTNLAANITFLLPPYVNIIGNDDTTAITIDDLIVNEGDGSAAFLLSLSAPSAAAVAVAYQSSDGTAVAGQDYVASSGTVTFTAGALTTTLTVPIIDDTLDEVTETLTVALSAAVPAATTTISDSVAVAQIVDNDEPPQLSIGDATVVENGGLLDFVLTLDQPSGLAVVVDYQSSDGTALAGQDYSAFTGQITLTAGALTATIPVPVLDDLRHELTETMFLQLSNAVNAQLSDSAATGTIIDNDPQPILTLNDSAITEGDSGTQTLFFTVTLSNSLATGFTIDYATQNGTALAGEDYGAVNGSLDFVGDDGEVQQIAVPINGDTTIEANETFSVTIAAVYASPYSITVASRAIGTILNDDFPVNLPPLAVADRITISEGSTVVVPVLANDSDPENGALTIVAVGVPSSGTALQGASTITYSAAADFAGTATMTYTIADPLDQRATATVTVIVTDHIPSRQELRFTAQNDANRDGQFSRQEDAPLGPAAQQIQAAAVTAFGDLIVPVQLTLANDGTEVLTVQQITDTVSAVGGSPCASWLGMQIGVNSTVQCTFTMTIAGDDNLTFTERIGIELRDNENNRVTQQAETVITTPDLAPQVTLRAAPDAPTAEQSVQPSGVISCTAQIVNLTPEPLILQTLNFSVELTPATGGATTTLPIATPASCAVPGTLAGLGTAGCSVTTNVPGNARHGDRMQCHVDAIATDDDGGITSPAVQTERYLVLDSPTDLPAKEEPPAQPTQIFLPWVASGE